jgi:LmbE family N-acetylglucosaminyl deacetylase
MRVLAIAAHPDDETLGCGGTLLKHKANGDELFWLIASTRREGRWTRENIEVRKTHIGNVTRAYGMTARFELGFPDSQLETVPIGDLMEKISNVISELQPHVVYCLHGGDVHTDHAAIYTATMSVLKPFYMKKLGIERVLCYEILSSTEAAPPSLHRAFVPNSFCDISEYLERKLEIMAMFETEVHPDPMPRGPDAIRALSRFRGSTISVQYAEAFMVIRELF